MGTKDKPTKFFFLLTGIVSTQGDLWKDSRRFAHTVLRDFGMGKSIIEERIHEELVHFIKRLHFLSARPFDPR